jgi:hypothetical protein
VDFCELRGDDSSHQILLVPLVYQYLLLQDIGHDEFFWKQELDAIEQEARMRSPILSTIETVTGTAMLKTASSDTFLLFTHAITMLYISQKTRE